MSQDLSSRDIRGLREQVAAQQAQLREAREAEEELRQLMELSTRLPRIQTEVEGLRAAVSGVDALQRELEELRETDVRRVKLFREISAFQAKVDVDNTSFCISTLALCCPLCLFLISSLPCSCPPGEPYRENGGEGKRAGGRGTEGREPASTGCRTPGKRL